MSIPGFSVRNPVTVNLLMWAIIIGGFVSWAGLVREFFPNVEPDAIRVTVAWPGATPEEVEKGIARRLERAVDTIDHVDEINTRVLEGVCVCTANFEVGTDMSQALNDVRSAVDLVKPELPDGADDPDIAEARFTMPVVGVVVFGDTSEQALRSVAREVRDDILDLGPVSRVSMQGVRARELRVEVRPEDVEAAAVTYGEVGRAVRAGNRDMPGGQLKGARGNVPVRTLGERADPHQLEALVVRSHGGGRVVRLGDLSDVRPGFDESVQRGSWKGRRAVMITVSKTSDEDALEIAKAVKGYLAKSDRRMGGAVQLELATDMTTMIEGRLDLMLRNARIGLLFVLITLAVFLELRVAFWVAAGLPVAFLATFIVMPYIGQSVNMISMFGLIVVLGMIVDDGIIIGENIFTKLREGYSPREAARIGAEEVTWPVLAAIATTVVAFAPMLFMDGRMGVFMAVIPSVVIAALTVSLIEAFLILPAHLSHDFFGGLRKFVPRGALRLGERFTAARKGAIESWLPGVYERALRFGLRWRYPALATAVAALLLAVGLVVGGIIKFTLFERTDGETISIDLEMAPGTPEAKTVAVVRRIERRAEAMPEVKGVFGMVGASFSEMGMTPAADPATVAQLMVQLHRAEDREAAGQRKSQAIEVELRKAGVGVAGLRKLQVKARHGGPAGGDLQLRVRGDELVQVVGAVNWLRELAAGFDGVEEIRDDLEPGKPEVRLALNESGEAIGLTTQGIAVAMRDALYGFEAQEIQDEDEEVTVRVVLPETDRATLADLGRLRIATPMGGRVPLEEVARLELERGYAALRRVDGKRAVTIEAMVDEDRGNLEQITETIRGRVADIGTRFPGVSVSFEGANKQTRESLGSLKIGFPMALLGIYAIIAMVFRSYLQPVIVMSVIPFAIVGAIAGHLIMGIPFQLLSMIGVVALAGIVVNDSLILVDFVNRRLREGGTVFEAVVQGGKSRLRAILLTTITTIAGLAPLMLERSFQARFLIPMAISICFGLAFATILTLGLVPILYLTLEDVRRLFWRVLTGKWPEPPQPQSAAH